MLIGLGVAFLLSAVLVSITLCLQTTRGSKDTPETFRVSDSGVMAVTSNIRDDANLLSRRLILYPTVMFLTGGLAVITGELYEIAPSAQIGGEIALMLSGFLNALFFFATDPTARKVARSLLEIIAKEEEIASPQQDSPVTAAALPYKRMSLHPSDSTLESSGNVASHDQTTTVISSQWSFSVAKLAKPFLIWVSK
ncbi:hypothetical protein HDU93_008832 [Gonapodya sp. JEL0774]|nr:hypothetical protein HDU93_008832 [Gonapodya sp. JEL0774]